MKKQHILFIALALLVVGVTVASKLLREPGVEPNTPRPTPTFSSEEYGIRFTHPSSYLVIEKGVGSTQAPQHAIILAEDTEENREVLEGRSEEPREGPPTITIEIHKNTSSSSPEEWIQENTNWSLRNGQLQPTEVDGNPATSFMWSGLYEGESTVVVTPTYAYIFSVTWITQEDQIRSDFENILESVELAL